MNKDFLKMQKLAGIITENQYKEKLLKEDTKIDKQGNLVYDLYDENSDWDFSDNETFMITWTLDKNVSNKKIQNKFEWDDEDFSVEVPIKSIIDFLKNSTEPVKNFEVSGGYISITKKDAADIIDSYYENWPDEVDPNLN
jgi:hypothetical protein